MSSIALDNHAILSGGGSPSPINVAYSCAGANRALIVYVIPNGAGNTITAISYNAISLTQLKTVVVLGSNYYCYGLLAPATGSNTLSISSSGGTIYATALSYTGVLQSGLPDATASKVQTAGPATLSNAITTVADECWITVGAISGAAAPTASSGITIRDTEFVTVSGDSNGAVSAGSNTQVFNVNSGADSAMIQVSLAPIPIIFTDFIGPGDINKSRRTSSFAMSRWI